MKNNCCCLYYKWVIIQNQTLVVVLVVLVVKSVLDMSNHAAGFDTSDLAAKNDFIALKAEIAKVDINTLSDIFTSLNNSKAKLDDLDVGKKNCSCRLKKIKWYSS